MYTIIIDNIARKTWIFVFQLLQGNQGRNMSDQSISISVSEPRKARRGLFAPIVYTINSKIRQETRNRFESNYEI